MKINIKASNIELTEAIHEYVQTKVDMLEKYLADTQVINCDFEVAKSVGGQNKGEIYRAEINLEIPGDLFRITKTEVDLYKSIDKVKDHMVEMIISHREKQRDRRRGR